MKDFRALLDLAHSNSMRVILDGVFNHCSRGFFAFVDLLENQEHSGYRDWFHVHKFPLDAYGPGKADHFEAWWGLKSLPKLNTRTKAVRQYIFDIARYWIEQGADGWRLDVPNEIDDDAFWAEFRQVVKNANPDAYLVGEIWTADKRWVGPGHFDGLMNYPVRDALVEFINTDFLSAGEFGKKIENLLSLYPKENGYAMYLPLGSHDTERIRTKLEGDVRKVKLAFAFLFAYPGAPAIYYGDEIGLTGDKDPECRGAFNWEHSSWNSELRNWVMTLIALRRKHPTLRRGDFQRVMAEDRKKLFAFSRTLGKETILVAVNAGPVQRNWRLPVGALGWEEGRILRNLLGRGEFVVSGEQISLQIAPWECIWIG
jgi:glycosidase